MNQSILILGGAGYIGSHTGYLLSQLGYNVIIIDDLLHGQNFEHKWATFIKGDFADDNILKYVFKKFKINAVMHFAALIEVGESVKRPKDFYNNNVSKTLKLLNYLIDFKVKNCIFSSSCAVYGNPIKIPIDEKHSYDPVSPYGKNKLTIEFALQDYANAYNFNYVSLRYFNAAGALAKEGLGEQHNPETHIIFLMLRAIKRKNRFKIFGDDYKTKDGTCVRDYIHVLDLANAHVLALKFLFEHNKSDVFNLGSGNGYSVKEMIDAVQIITSEKMIIKKCKRREGDVDTLIADYSKAQDILSWKPKYSDLKNILTSAWEWENFNT